MGKSVVLAVMNVSCSGILLLLYMNSNYYILEVDGAYVAAGRLTTVMRGSLSSPGAVRKNL